MEEEQKLPYVVPGLQASKGDRVLKSLQKLWSKILQLEESKINVNDDVQPCEDVADADESLNDLQLKLLQLQLKYINKLLQERNATQLSPENLASSSSHSSSEGNHDDLDTVPVKLEKETQTSKTNLIGQSNCSKGSAETKMKAKVNFVKRNAAHKKPEERGTVSVTRRTLSKSSNAFPASRLKTCSHSHYHMKLSDVPFIVGQSTGASHSVIANVQSIIGMMKMHNAALCTSPATNRELQPCWKTVEPTQSNTDMRTMKKQLKKLAKELNALTMKQEELKLKLSEIPQSEDEDETYQEYNSISKLMEIKAREIVEFHRKMKKQESTKSSPNEVTKKDKISKDAVTHRMQKEPQGITVKVGNITELKMKKARTVSQLQVEDIVWT